jgi:PBSX family phage portal protein
MKDVTDVATTDDADAVTPQSEPVVFTFGEPVPALENHTLLDYLECGRVGDWYEMPLSAHGLAKAFRSAAHHESAIHFKANVLTSCFKPSAQLSRQDFRRLVLDYIVFGNCYLEERRAINRRATFKPSLALYTRRGVDLESFWFVQGYVQSHRFDSPVYHVMEPDVTQEVYGLPQYISALQSAFLNENATLFRRRYYLNNSSAGFILYVNDTAQSQEDIDAMRQALRDAKGIGNFKNLFLYAPNGKKDGIQVIPISEVAAKDEFLNIKNVSRDDILAAHRAYPQLMGLAPEGTGSFGDIGKAAVVFARHELEPLMARFEEFNEQVGGEIVAFDPYKIGGLSA